MAAPAQRFPSDSLRAKSEPLPYRPVVNSSLASPYSQIGWSRLAVWMLRPGPETFLLRFSHPTSFPSMNIMTLVPKPGRKNCAVAIMQTPSATPFTDIIHSLAELHQGHNKGVAGYAQGPSAPVPNPCPRPARGPQAVPELNGPGGSSQGTISGCCTCSTHAPASHEDGRPGRPGDVSGPLREDRRGLLTGRRRMAVQQLPVQNFLVYQDLKRAILQRVGLTPEQHRQRFRSLDLRESGRPFVLAQQHRDACRR